MKKLFSLFVAMMAAFSLSAKTIYCQMSQSWWTAEGAAVGIYTWNDNSDPKAAWPGERMTLVEGTTDVWSFDLDTEIYHMCIFTRVNGEGDVADFGAKTGDQLIPTDDKNLFTITSETAVWGDPGCVGVWSVYGEEPVDPFVKIVFGAAKTADELAENEVFAAEGSEFSATITDPDNKMAIDANTARFGTPEAFTDYTHRLKTGGKSSSTKNFFTLNIPAAGQLRIAVRTGSNSATDRNLVIAQGEDTLYNQVIKEDDKTVVPGEGGDTNYYPYVIVPVQAGSVVLTYPVNGLNFYAFGFKAGETPEPPVDQPKFYITGTQNLVGTEKSQWDPAAIPVMEDSKVLALEAGSYMMKVNLDGEWNANVFGYDALSVKPENVTRGAEGTGDNDNICFKLAEAGNVTVTFIYGDPLVFTIEGNFSDEAPAQLPVVKIAGSLTSWSEPVEMTPAEDGLSATLTLSLGIDHYQLKVVSDGNWLTKIGGDNDLFIISRDWPKAEHVDMVNIPENNLKLITDMAGDYTFTWVYADSSLYVTFPSKEIPELRLADGYYLIGLTMADWTVEYITADYLFVENAENPGEYKLDVTLAAEQQFKIVKVESDVIKTWYPDGMDNNYIVDAAHAGAKTVYFRPDGQGGQDWHYGMIFVPANEEGIEEVIAAGKAAKIVRDGQLLILKGNKTFNAQGAIVK